MVYCLLHGEVQSAFRKSPTPPLDYRAMAVHLSLPKALARVAISPSFVQLIVRRHGELRVLRVLQ